MLRIGLTSRRLYHAGVTHYANAKWKCDERPVKDMTKNGEGPREKITECV
jgi:hypothetical protein